LILAPGNLRLFCLFTLFEGSLLRLLDPRWATGLALYLTSARGELG